MVKSFAPITLTKPAAASAAMSIAVTIARVLQDECIALKEFALAAQVTTASFFVANFARTSPALFIVMGKERYPLNLPTPQNHSNKMPATFRYRKVRDT